MYHAKYVAKTKNSISRIKILHKKIVNLSISLLSYFWTFECKQRLFVIADVLDNKYMTLSDTVYVSFIIWSILITFYILLSLTLSFSSSFLPFVSTVVSFVIVCHSICCLYPPCDIYMILGDIEYVSYIILFILIIFCTLLSLTL